MSAPCATCCAPRPTDQSPSAETNVTVASTARIGRGALSAPLPVRAVLRGLTLAARDGGWRVGHGAVRTVAASDIVLFLFGRSGVPDEAPADYDGGE